MKKFLYLFPFLVFFVHFSCNSTEEGIGVTVVTPETNQGLEGVLENTSLELYADITYILDLDYNDQYEDQSCNYRYQVILYIGEGSIVEQISYQYRVCADENSRECAQKQVYNLSFDFVKIDKEQDHGFFIFESREIIKSYTTDENDNIDENNSETYYFLENGTTTIDEVREYSCKDQSYN